MALAGSIFWWQSRQRGGAEETARRMAVMQGATMGTSWLVRIPAGERAGLDGRTLFEEIVAELKAVNQEMSTYLPTSELSRFNASESTEWQSVSPATAAVAARAKEIGVASGGALDVTLGPLIELWGFGPDGPRRVPDEATFEATRSRVGLERLRVRLAPPALAKAVGGLRVDLSAIAKGHGVDRIAEVLRRHGVDAWFIEIGGEIRVAGEKAPGVPWRIGIEQPRAKQRAARKLMPLRDRAIATSGDYRNFFEEKGQRFSHVLDPTTGRPVTHALASVSVVAEDCATADGWATALLVLGPEEGYNRAIAEKLAALFIVRTDDGFQETATPAFESLFDGR